MKNALYTLILPFLLVLAACSDGNPEAANTSPSASEVADQADAGPVSIVDRARSLLVPGTEFPLGGSHAGILESNSDGTADHAPIMDENGKQRGSVSLVREGGKIVVYGDDEPFVFIPYYLNTGGSAAMLTIGRFRISDDNRLQMTSRILVDDRAEIDGMDALGDGKFLLRARGRGPGQMPSEPAAQALAMIISRDGPAMEERAHYFAASLDDLTFNSVQADDVVRVDGVVGADGVFAEKLVLTLYDEERRKIGQQTVVPARTTGLSDGERAFSAAIAPLRKPFSTRGLLVATPAEPSPSGIENAYMSMPLALTEAFAAAAPDALKMTDEGLGPITGQSRYATIDTATLAARFREMRIDESEGEAGTVSIISFIGDGGAIDAVYAKDGPLLSISSTMSDIASDVGVSLGEPMFEAMARFRGVMGGDVPPSTCGRGLEAFSGNMVCSYRDHPHLAVLFSGPVPENVPDTWIPESEHELAPRWVAIRHLWLDDPRQYFEAAE